MPEMKIIFVYTLLHIVAPEVKGAKLNKSDSTPQNSDVPETIRFEFSHEEHLVIGDDDFESDQENFNIDETGVEDGGHIRRKRNAQWVPDYDLYGQWAKEYYANYEASKVKKKPKNIYSALVAAARAAPPKEEAPKKDILDLLLDIRENKTKEETEQDRIQRKKKKESMRNTFKWVTWLVGTMIVVTFFWRFIVKILAFLGLDFCDSLNFKKKVQKIVNACVPGVFIHPNGRREFYIPTEEELEALKELKKLLWGMRLK